MNGNYELRMTNYESTANGKDNYFSVLSLIRNCLLALLLSAQCFVSDAYAANPLSNDPDFVVGVTGHPGWEGNPAAFSGYGSSDADIERQVHLSAEMGAKIYRIHAHDFTADIFERVITLCERYGIEIMAQVNIESGATVANRFKGRVKYYQVNNEMDSQALKSDGLGGTQISHFWMSTDTEPLPAGKKYLDVMINDVIDYIKIIRAEDPDAKVLINGGWVHYAFLDYAFERFAEAGVDIDLIGWDWYSNMEGNRDGLSPAAMTVRDGLNSVAKYIYDCYGKDIIICEYNMSISNFDKTSITGANYVPFLPGNGNGKIDPFEEDNMDTLMGTYLVNNIQYLYNNRAENHIKGILIYELIDEPGHFNPFEAKFGITYAKILNFSQRRYQILGPKKAYYDVQKLFGGGFVPIQRLNPSAVLHEHTITASVIDEDTDGTVLFSQEGGTVAGSGIYRENSVVTLTATANPGYEFLGWYRGGIRISKTPVYKFTAYEDANNADRDSAEGKFVYEARYVFRGACEGSVITFPVISKDGAQKTGMLTIPAKTFGADVKIDAQQYVSLVPAAKSYVRELSRAYIAAIIAAPEKKPEREMELRLPYNNSDIAGMNEDTLVISKYDEEKNMWVPLKSKADNVNKQIIANIDKLSLYAIMGTTNTVKAFEDVKYYPNPIQPSKGMNYAKMNFSNIPSGTRIKIYTMLGQIVRELEADASGMAVWDGKNNAGAKAASGVYIAYMEDGNGNKKRIKIVVER
ncbi:MAG: T9SS type A sorting domain-containing protein [Endomicrobia bacterium]|nr:T9SS type A sorting domain-containing protein [Endomicrobiia bacterium]